MESNLKHRLSQDGAPLIPKLPLQTRHINHKAIFHIAFLHTLIGGVDVLHIYHLHIWHDRWTAPHGSPPSGKRHRICQANG